MQNFGPVLFLITVIVGLLVFYQRKKDDHRHEESDKAFWLRESKADSVRRKDITFLNYLTISLDSLPMEPSDDEEIKECQDTVAQLATQRVLNLSGISNTDLKMEYGAANLPLLSDYDNNYTILVNTLSKWGGRLIECDDQANAIRVLEYGISIGSDVSRTYYMLADIYRQMNRPNDIDRLIESAARIDSIMKTPIIKKLNEIRSYCN